jgi:hypothetical protein
MINQLPTTWERVMALRSKDDMHRGVANTLKDEDIETIIATIDFFGGDYKQDLLDLKTFRYRVFDWLAMRINGRHSDNPSENTCTKVLAHSFLKSNGTPSKMIDDLRTTDYDIDLSYETIALT